MGGPSMNSFLSEDNFVNIFPGASNFIFSTCEEHREGEFSDFMGVEVVQTVTRIISLFKDLPGIKEQSQSMLVDLEAPCQTAERIILDGGLYTFRFENEITELLVIKVIDDYFRFLNVFLLPAVKSLYNRLLYMDGVMSGGNEGVIEFLSLEVQQNLQSVVTFLFRKTTWELHYWNKIVRKGNACKTSEDKLKLLDWIL